MAGTLEVSNVIWVLLSWLALGFDGSSVNNTGSTSGRRGVPRKMCDVTLSHVTPSCHDAVLDSVLDLSSPRLFYASSSPT